MPKLPVVSGIEVIKALAKVGYDIDHQTGSHMILRLREAPLRRLAYGRHSQSAKGTLRAIIREAGLTVEELLELL